MIQALNDCEALVSALNISRRSDFPWAKLRTPPTLLSDVMNNVGEIAVQVSLKRLVVCSAWGAGETKKDLPAWFRWVIDHSNVGVTYQVMKDKKRCFEVQLALDHRTAQRSY